MTEPPSLQSRWWIKALAALGVLVCLGLTAFWFLTTATFWERVGWRLVAAVQDRVTGKVEVAGVSGNLMTGMVFTEVVISRPQGDILRVQELEVSLSLRSFLKLQPVIRTLVFRQPQVFLRQDTAGTWNVANLLKKRPPPPFSRIHLPGIRVLGGRVQVDTPTRSLALQDLQVELNLSVHAPGRPRLAVVLHEAAMGFTSPPYPAVQAQMALTYTAQELDLEHLDISLAQNPVLGLKGKITDLDAAPHLALALTMPEISGAQLQRLWPRWPRTLPWQAGLEITGPLANLRLQGAGRLQDCRWQIEGLWQQNGANSPTYDLTGTFRHLTGEVLSAWQDRGGPTGEVTPLTGKLTLAGTGVSWPPRSLSARLEVQPFAWRQAKVEAAALTLKLANGHEQTAALNLQGNFGRLEGDLKGRFLPLAGSKSAPVEGELKLAAKDLNPALLLGPQAPPGAVTLTLAGNFQVPAPWQWSKTRGTGTLQAAGKIRDYAFQEGSVKGSWEAGELRLSPARLVMGGLRAEAQGSVSSTRADLKWHVNLAGPGPWPPLPADFKGDLRAEGALQGPWNALAYQVSWQGQALSWRQLRLAGCQGRAAGLASRERFTISHFDLLARDLKTPAGRFGLIQGSGRTQGDNLAFNLAAKEAPGQSGALAGVAAWEHKGAQIKITTFRWGPPDFQVTTGEPVTLTVAPGRLELTPVRLRHRQTQLFLAGRLTREAVAAQLNLENLQIADVARFIPQVGLIQGALQLQTDISGTPGSPVIRGQVELAPGQISRFHFDSFQTSWHYQNNLLSLTGFLLEKADKGKLSWQGSTPLVLSLLPWSWQMPDSGLHLRAWSDNVTLGLFSQLIPNVSASEGPMALQAEATGSLRRPVLAGALRYGPGTLTVQESGAPFAIAPGEIRLEGDRLVLGGLVFHSGDGQGVITGGARLEGLKLVDVQLNLAATNLTIIRRDGSQAAATGQITLKGSWPNFRVDGNLRADQGKFRLAFFRSDRNRDIIILPRVCRPPSRQAAVEGAVAVERNFELNLTVDIPGGVWLQDKDINGELEGQIKVLRQAPGPKYLGGWVRAKGGVFAINNKIFTVEKAMLVFPGQPHRPAMVEARAARQVDEYTLWVFAHGPLDNPRTGLESNPPLPPRDQLSLLVFDHLADRMTREEYITATQKAMGLVGSFTLQKIKTLLGEGLPFLGEVSPTTSQEALGVGKKLSKDITVSYERKLNPLQGEDVNQVRLDYKIHKHFTAETQLGRKNTGGDLFFNIDF